MNCSPSRQWNAGRHQKGMSRRAMKRPRGDCNAHYGVKEANLKRLHRRHRSQSHGIMAKQSYGDSKKSVAARNWEPGGVKRWSTEDFRAMKKLLRVILQWGVHVIMRLSRPTESATARVNPNVNSRPRVIMTHQGRFRCNNCTPGEGVDGGEAELVWGRG